MDSRQVMIVLQNSMAHATAISLHNSKGKEVNHEDVIELAKKIAKEVINTANGKSKKKDSDSTFKQASKHFKKDD